MGLDYYLIASRRGGKASEEECFFFRRASWLGHCLLSYFSARVPVHRADDDEPARYCLLTLGSWNRLMAELEAHRKEIAALSAYVEAVFDFDPEVPSRYRELQSFDWRRAVRFSRWFSGAITHDDPASVIELTEENAHRIIDDAFTLTLCMELDEALRPYLQDPDYVIRLGIG